MTKRQIHLQNDHIARLARCDANTFDSRGMLSENIALRFVCMLMLKIHNIPFNCALSFLSLAISLSAYLYLFLLHSKCDALTHKLATRVRQYISCHASLLNCTQSQFHNKFPTHFPGARTYATCATNIYHCIATHIYKYSPSQNRPPPQPPSVRQTNSRYSSLQHSSVECIVCIHISSRTEFHCAWHESFVS